MIIEIELTRKHLVVAVLAAAITWAISASATDGQTRQLSAATAPVLPMGPVATVPAAPPAPASAVALPTPATPPALPAAAVAAPAQAAAPAPAPAQAAAPAPAPAPAADTSHQPVKVTQAPASERRVRHAPAHRTVRSHKDDLAEILKSDVPPIPASAVDAVRRADAWASNEAATVEGASDGRVVFTFGETMPTIVCAPLRICDIELQPGEKVIGAPNAGDTVRWDITPAKSGTGAAMQWHVVVKPKAAGLDTNLLIATDRRTYHLRLVSDAANYVSTVAFAYPDDQKQAWDAALKDSDAKQANVVATLPAVTADSLNFNYTIKRASGSPGWAPIRAFDDGSHTYIQMPASMASTEAPVLVLLDADGNEQITNARLKGDYYVVDRVIERAALEAGVGRSQERVLIQRMVCTKRSFFGRCKN